MNKLLPVFLLILFALMGCSSGASVTTAPDTEIQKGTDSTHHLWGLWQFTADPVAGTLDCIQLRSTDMHINVLPFLEPPPFVNLTLEALEFNGNLIEVDIGLRHPFLGLTEFSGFDVCGILITNGSVTGFTDSSIRMTGEGDTRLLNPDGLARWWNPTEFPHNAGMLGYNDGLLGKPDSSANFDSTINAYKFFCDELTNPDSPVSDMDCESRCVFNAGQKNIRHYTIELGNEGLVFNYAVDACWEFPSGSPPWTVPDDFGEGANRVEAWNISVTETNNNLFNDGVSNGGSLSLLIDVWDHYNSELNMVYADSPGNFTAVGPESPIGGGPGYSTYSIDITTATPDEGSIDVLITVESEDSGYGGIIPGEPVCAYFLHTAEVSETAAMVVAVAEFYPDPPNYICDIITFDASESYDLGDAEIVKYEWDWDNDGNYEDETTDPVITHSWPSVGTYYVQLRVTNDQDATDTLDEPLEIDILTIIEPTLIENLTGIFHSPYCSKVDTQNNDGWVDCTQASPVLDFGFYKIDNDEDVEKVFEKTGSGFLGMPGPFGLNVEARKIIAPDMLGFEMLGPAKVDVWDLDGGADLQFNIPYNPAGGGVAFLGDGELFGDLSVAVVCDTAVKPLGRLVTWDYTESSPTYSEHFTAEFPNLLEADYEGHRLFVYCRGSFGGPGPTIEVWDASDWTKITSFQTQTTAYESMTDIDYHPALKQLYFGSGSNGAFEVWETETYTHVKTVNTGYGVVRGIDHMGCGIYVTVPGRLLVYNANTFNLLFDVACGTDPRVLSCNPNNHKIYVPDMGGQTVFVFQG